jgi:hypothetical protein
VLTVKGALPGTTRPDGRKLVNVDTGSFACLLLPSTSGRVLARRKVELGRAEAQADGRQVPDVRGILLAVVMAKGDITPTKLSFCSPRSSPSNTGQTMILAAETCMGADVRNCAGIGKNRQLRAWTRVEP